MATWPAKVDAAALASLTPHPAGEAAVAQSILRCKGQSRRSSAAAIHAGDGEARAVEGQVQQLLTDAQDPENLSKMYVGWAAWM